MDGNVFNGTGNIFKSALLDSNNIWSATNIFLGDLCLSQPTQEYCLKAADTPDNVLFLEGQTAATDAVFAVASKDSDATDKTEFRVYGQGGVVDSVNFNYVAMTYDPDGVNPDKFLFTTAAGGTGPCLPMEFATAGNAAAIRIEDTGIFTCLSNAAFEGTVTLESGFLFWDTGTNRDQQIIFLTGGSPNIFTTEANFEYDDVTNTLLVPNITITGTSTGFTHGGLDDMPDTLAGSNTDHDTRYVAHIGTTEPTLPTSDFNGHFFYDTDEPESSSTQLAHQQESGSSTLTSADNIVEYLITADAVCTMLDPTTSGIDGEPLYIGNSEDSTALTEVSFSEDIAGDSAFVLFPGETISIYTNGTEYKVF